MSFIQIIEYRPRTTRIDELNAALDKWLEPRASEPPPVASRPGTATRPTPHVQIVEFPSHEDAMANSNLPETSEFAAQLAALCDGPPTFRNIDVLREEQM